MTQMLSGKLHVNNLPANEKANFQTTTSLLSQSLCLKKFAENKMGRTTKHQVTQNGLVNESRLNQVVVT